MDIKHAKVLITGGSSGIGYETARQLHSAGARVVICGRDEQKLKKALGELDVKGIQADVSSEEDIKRLFGFALDRLGGLNVLINNAGTGSSDALADLTLDDFTKTWEINVKGALLAGQAAARHFISQNTGNIINIGSSSALKGYAGGSSYVASKFALSGLTECWRAELRPHNIRVMQVNPSEVVTGFGSRSGQRVNADKKLKPGEIAHVIVSMLSMNDVGFITDAAVWATNPR